MDQLEFSVCVKKYPAQFVVEDVVDTGICSKGANGCKVPMLIDAGSANGELGESADGRPGC